MVNRICLLIEKVAVSGNSRPHKGDKQQTELLFVTLSKGEVRTKEEDGVKHPHYNTSTLNKHYKIS